MAPVKFGLFKARSRNYQEQPSTENLLQYSNSIDTLALPGSPIASTSHTSPEELAEIEMAALRIQYIDLEEPHQKTTPTRRASASGIGETQLYSQILYQQFKDEPSCSSTYLEEQYLETLQLDEDHNAALFNVDLDNLDDDASTSCDVNSLQYDETLSIAPSEDLSVHCGALKRQKKSKSKEEQHLRDLDMWQATNVEVMENLLSRSGTLDEQIKWEAIATARGLCTLTDNCGCNDCMRAKYLAEITDGDGGMGAAPLFNAITVGCCLQ